MGNPNILWYKWGNLRQGVTSAVQATTLSAPLQRNGGSVSLFNPPTDGRGQVVTGGKGADLIQIREWHVEEIGSGFPDTRGVDINFEINQAPWYILHFVSRQTPPQLIDFGITRSNTIPGSGGDAPLIIDGGADIRILIVDGNRPNNSDRVRTMQDLWGIKI